MSSDSMPYAQPWPERLRDGARQRSRVLPARLQRVLARPELIGLLGLTAILNLWSLSINGWANTYYSAAVRSMTTSWHDFLFASLDKSGVMTVDKPPLSLWVQAISARVFGFHPLSLLVPQALMGVAAVGLTYDLVRRRFDGELLFAGRRDSQIKTRGYRVELGEIEAALNAIEGVVEAAVVAVPDETITNRLRAFVVTAEPIASAQLQRLCRERLPGHMIPDEIEFRSELPKSSTGKVDRRALQR